VDWTKYAPIRKVWAAIIAAAFIGVIAAVEALMGYDGLSELGLAGPVVGAALAAGAAYMRRNQPKFPTKGSFKIDADPHEQGDH
jgi:hypothetical protein